MDSVVTLSRKVPKQPRTESVYLRPLTGPKWPSDIPPHVWQEGDPRLRQVIPQIMITRWCYVDSTRRYKGHMP